MGFRAVQGGGSKVISPVFRVSFPLFLLLFFSIFLSAVPDSHGFGLSLDEMYRMSLRRENEGVLPGYVVNRGQAPWPEPKPLTPGERDADTGAGVLSLPLTEPLPWPQVVKEVATGNPGPFAVDAVRRRARSDDAEAVELLAWMYAGGVGVHKDLAQSFELYLKANRLGVTTAKNNASSVYRSMTVAERRTVFNPFN